MGLDIYPAIDIKGGKCVRLVQGRFDDVTTYGDDPAEMARRWQDAGALRLHVVDLDGAKSGADNSENYAAICRIVEQTGLPVQFGGGVRTSGVVSRMLDAGVARVVLGTAAARDPIFAEAMFRKYGDRVAVGVDARNGVVAVQGWQESSGEQATAFVVRMAALGARRFIFTDIARDGMLQGINTEALAQVAATVPDIPMIASGGVATLADLDALKALRNAGMSNVDGVIIGKALYAGSVTLADVLVRAQD